MATKTTTTSGNLSAGATWVGGVAPVVTVDKIVIAHPGTAFGDFSTDAAGYAIGATAITLTGAVAAGSYVIGESVQFGTDPNYYTITNWNSATKVLTVTAIAVAIPASATVVYNVGHAVTIDATGIYGDDPGAGVTSITINGALVYPTTGNFTITASGDVTVNSGGTLDMGRKSTGRQFLVGNSATLKLNYSAALAQVKYGLVVNDGGRIFAYGATRTTNTYLSSGITAGATSCTVNDATGWQVGDVIVIATSDGTYNHHEEKTLTSVAGTTVGWTGGLSWAHAANCKVGNFTSNVTITSHSTANAGYFGTRTSSTASNSKRELDYLAINHVTSDTSNANKILLWASGSTLWNPFVSFTNVKFYNCSQIVAVYSLFMNMGTFAMDNLAFYNSTTTGQVIYTAQGSYLNFTNTVVYYSPNSHIFSFNGSGGQGCTYTNFTSCGANAVPWQFPSGNGNIFINSSIHSTNNPFISAASGLISLTGCNLGTNLWGTPVTTSSVAAFSVAQVCNVTMTDTKVQSITGASSITTTNPSSNLLFVNKNADVTSQENYTSTQVLVRDNSTYTNSPSSEKFNPIQANVATGRTYTVPAPNNTLRRVIGYLRYDANYTNTTPPSVTLSGLGITPQTYTAGASTNTWYKFDLSATQTSGADGNLTLTVTGTSPNTTGFYWVSGVVDSPFVTSSRHYGYIFDSLIYKTVDPVITQTTEATVGAYTGITIDHTTNTITLTSDHSINELYDYCYYNLCLNANKDEPEFFTSPDGNAFTSTYNLVLNGGDLTGSGTLDLGANTLTITAGETTTVPISYGSGTGYYTNLSISGLVANSMVYVYDLTGATELYRARVAGTSVSIPVLWTGVDHNLEIKATNVPGPGTAYLPWQGASAITNATPSVTALQEVDAIYNANGVDGSAVTKFSTDYPNVQADVSSGTSYTVQELYAWFQWVTDSDQGILYFFNGLTMPDSVNLRNDPSVVNLFIDNTSGHNIDQVGGYFAKTDGTSWIYPLTAHSIIPIYDRAYTANSDDIERRLKYLAFVKR